MVGGMEMSWFQRVLRSRSFYPFMVATALALLAGIAVNALMLLGQWPPQLPQTRSAIVITNPSVNANATIQAYILGAVRSPGVYTLPRGARVHDLLAAAGGALDHADLTRVALAEQINDGQTIYVPLVGETIPLQLGGKIDLNVASAEDLHHALDLSLTIARRIVAYRIAHGHFTAVSQLLLVPISRSTYDRIKDLVTV